MEIRVQRGGGGERKAANTDRNRLRKHAPAPLQVKVPTAGDPAWEADGGASARTPIPLLSPLATSPMPPWAAEVDDAAPSDGQLGEETTSPVSSPAEGWRHPALPMAVVEPASLAPFFQVQCALVHNMQ